MHRARASSPRGVAPGAARHAIRIRGIVQGVGLRPTVYRLARAARLGGYVRNDADGVILEIEGDRDALARFPKVLHDEAPPLARIDAMEVEEVVPCGERDFRIAPSAAGAGATTAAVPADAAVCEACLREMWDPEDRRHRHPFISCTDCGPRYTIIRDVPYDRSRTTMAAFSMCAACGAEYEDPADRRFHAEPIACRRCGPRAFLTARGERLAEGDAAVARAARLLASGAILAIKGLGGYQLAVDALDEDAVARLRERKRRPDKPFALMARDRETLRAFVRLSPEADRVLGSPARPIVLLPAVPGSPIAPSVAPGLGELGVMLPTTPLHHLLLGDGPALLVMTSGNVADEPIAADDDEAARALGRIADAFLAHDRAIHTRADDSVVRLVSGGAQVVRRARGLAPDPLPLGADAPPVLAVGAQMKNAVCLTRGAQAFVSQHIGDLSSVAARGFFEDVVAKLTRLLGVSPWAVAHDLHPDYASTRWALGSGLEAIAVQHHHAHVAACLAEHGRAGPAIGVAFDGTGCGPAGELWGGEFLVFDLDGFRRAGHLRPLALPGGEAAIREPWRLAISALADAGEPVAEPCAAPLLRMIARGSLAPLSTGAGRWFDAVAAILRIRRHITYEAQAAIELEAVASTAGDAAPYPFELEAREPFVVDLRPAIRAVASDARAGEPRATVAARFYATMAEAVLASCRVVRRASGLGIVALSGGCFQSVLLTEGAKTRLEADGFEVLVHRRVPPNDGGIAFGQAAIAARRLASGARGEEHV
jgi:hydrogenase maturation protein HypF